MNLLVIFLTGLTTGGLSCLAMQGGLLTSVIANQKDQERDELLSDQQKQKAAKKQKYLKSLEKKNFSLKSFDKLDWQPVLMFLAAKLTSHTILGFLLGLLGSAITLSLGVRLAFQVFTAIFMLATAMNLLDVHPIFRYVVFQSPKFIRRFVRNSSRSQALFAPGILGFLTVFVPCGVTQAMEVLAINTGNPVSGALIMFAFVLGTSPLFAILGVAAAKLSEGWYKNFTRFTSIVLIAMAAYSINGVLLVLGSPITLNSIVRPVAGIFSGDREAQALTTMETDGVQEVTINVLSRGYQPNYVKVKKGVPVKLTLNSNETYSCALAFVLKEYGINTFLKSTDSQSFTFTPQNKGRFTFTCSMGMYSGTLEVI